MSIINLIKKIDDDRKQLPAYPSLKELIPAKSLYQNNFLTQLNTVLVNHDANQETKNLKQAVNKIQQKAFDSSKLLAQHGERVKHLNQQDAPEKLLEKVQLIRKQIDNTKIGFLNKKKLYKALAFKEAKYLEYAKLVEGSKQVSNELSSLATKNISLEQIAAFKDKLKELGYYECLTGNVTKVYSIMPELLNKKYMLKGDKYE